MQAGFVIVAAVSLISQGGAAFGQIALSPQNKNDIRQIFIKASAIRARAVPPHRAFQTDSARASGTKVDLAISKVLQTMLSRMESARRETMEKIVDIHTVERDQRLMNFIADTLNNRLSSADSTAILDHLRREYANRRSGGDGGRTPDEPRGLTITYRDGRDVKIFSFVGWENLSSDGDWDENGSRSWRILVHELGHAVARGTFTEEERMELKKISTDLNNDNPDEFFAEGTEIWFGVHQRGLYKLGVDAGQIPAKFASMMRFMERIYGSPRNVR